MLSLHLIERHYRQQRLEQLFDELLGEARAAGLPLKLRLLQSPATLVSLALRRLAELTFGPSDLSREMLDLLLAAQESDGSFDHDPLATAAAAAAFAAMDQQWHAHLSQTAAAARERAVAALADMQADDSLFHHSADRATAQRQLVAAAILWLLAGDPLAAAVIRHSDLCTYFEERLDDLPAEVRALATPALRPTSRERDMHITAA
jgi:hypothetical protein